MTTPHRSRILGDLDENAPERWEWGGPGGPRIDLALLLYARDDAGLARARAGADARRSRAGGLALRHRLGTSDLDDFEPFGFRDGISQPFVEGLSKTGPPETTVRAGEFVLGYPNEYGLYTDRPLLDAAADPRKRAAARRRGLRPRRPRAQRQLPRLPPAAAGRARLLALRRRRDAARRRDERPAGAASARREDGRALAERRAARARARRRRPEPRRRRTTSATTSSTARGARCPVGSHIRRSNPRDSLDPRPGSSDSWTINRRHRILRRGREYGTSLTIEQALAGGDGERARPELHLPEREHRSASSSSSAHVAEQPEVRRALRRRRSARRAVGARTAGRSRSRPTACASA